MARPDPFGSDPRSDLFRRAKAIDPRDATRDDEGPGRGAHHAVGPDGSGRSSRLPALALLFLLLALPTTLIQVYLTPPIQVADEENHFLRALQVADGHLFGQKLGDGNAGGVLDEAAPVFAHAFDALKFRPGTKLDLGAYAAAGTLTWGGGREPAAFPNTAIYPFFLYLPGSMGLALGEALHLSVLDSFYLARLATALASVGLAALALAVCGRGRALLFVVLCFPMTLSLFASASQDGLSAALGALAAGLLSGYAARDAAMPPPARAVLSLALGAVAAARIPLVFLLALAALPTRSGARGRLRAADWAAAALGLVPLAVGVYGAKVAKVAFREGDGVSPPGQLRWLAAHPAEAVGVAAHTLQAGAVDRLRELIGVLGWLDTALPGPFYAWMAACGLAALAIDALSGEAGVAGLRRAVPLLAVAASVAGVFGTFYLAWTPVGAATVDGVQGRYFIVPALVLAVSLPTVGRAMAPPPRAVAAARLALCGAVGLVDLWAVPITLLRRYYG